MKKKIDSREISKIKKLTSGFNDLKKLKYKHFIRKDRVALGKRLESDEKKIQRLICPNLEKTTKDIKKFENLKRKYKQITKILDKDIKELDLKLRILKQQTKKVSEEKRRLSKKRIFFQKKILRLNDSLKLERGKKRETKKEKLKV